MKVLVTGANGFIGSQVVRALLAKGRNVKGLVQTATDQRNLTGLDLEIVQGDLRDRHSLAHALEECRVVYHLAAYNNLWSANPKLPYQINVTGTLNLMEEALKKGVEKVIYASSATLFRLDNGHLAREEDWLRNPPGNGYEGSKYWAEEEVFRFARKGMTVVSIAPTAPIGPGDLNLTNPGRLIVNFLKRELPAYLNTGFNVVDVKVLGRAFLAAETCGKSNERYIVGGVNILLKDILSQLEILTGIPAPKRQVPYWVAYAVSFASEKYSDWISKKPPLAPLEGVRLVKSPCFYDCKKAIAELGLEATDVNKAVQEEVQWFRENGYV